MLPLKIFSEEMPSLEFLEFLAADDAEDELLGDDEMIIVNSTKQGANKDDAAAPAPEKE